MARKRQAMHQGGVGVDDAEEHALALFDADRVARTQRVAVDGESAVMDFERAFIPFSAAASREIGLPAVERQRNLLVVARRVLTRLDDENAELAGVGGAMQVASGVNVGVIPSRAGWPRHEGITSAGRGRAPWGAFFGGAIDFGRNEEAVPVDQLGRGGLVDDLHGHCSAFGEAQNRAGKRAVVADRTDGALGSDGDIDVTDLKRKIGRRLRIKQEGG